MKNAFYILICVFAIALSGIAFSAELAVPGTYATIQAAIDAASPGDTIKIAAGTYSENNFGWTDIQVFKSVDIVGAGSGSTIVQLTGLQHGIEIGGGGSGKAISVKGITFTKLPTNTYSAGWAIIVGETYTGFTSLTFEDVEIAYAEARNLHFANSSYDSILIKNCNIHHAGAWGFSARGTITAMTVKDSDFEYNGTVDAGHGIGFDIDMPNIVNYLTIKGGSFSNNTAKGINLVKSANVKVHGAKLNNNGGAPGGGFGISLWEWSSGSSNLSFTNNEIKDNSLDGILFGTEGTCTISNVKIAGNIIEDNGRGGIFMYGAYGGSISNLAINFNSLAGNGVGLWSDYSTTFDAEKNWWGSSSGPATGAVVGNFDTDPYLTSTLILDLAQAGLRLVALQNDDGGWDWPLDDCTPTTTSPLNTIAPIGMGLAKAYNATGDADMLTALGKTKTLLLTKTNNFSPSDGYLAKALDFALGGTACVDHMNTYFYGPLAAGTYDKSGLGTLYDTAGYVNLIRTNRASQGIPNLAAWDVGMGLVAAATCGVSGTDLDAWIAGVKGEIDELDGDDYYDVIGLAGAVYALAFVGEDFDPTSGEHAAASSLQDLADILASYQIEETGGFAWNKNYVIPDDYNEVIQETAYALLALREVGGYDDEVSAAAAYIASVQLFNGGWYGDEYWDEENNEVTAEANWALAMGFGNILSLDATPETLYIKTGELAYIDMNASNLIQKVKACQAFLGYDSTYLSVTSVVEGGGAWDDLIWAVYSVPGEIDTAVGVYGESYPSQGTDADGTVAILTFTALAEGVTQVVFRPDLDPDPGLIGSTYFSDMDANPVWPTKIDSIDIVIDNTPPYVTVTSPNGGEYLQGGGTWEITWTATDTYIDPNSVVIEYWDGSAWVLIAEDEANDGTYTWDPVPSLDISTALVRVTVSDLAGNSTSDVSDAVFTIDSTDPTISNITLTVAPDGSGTDLTPNGTAIQGTYTVSVYVSDSGSGIDWATLPTISVTDSASTELTVGSVTADETNGRFTVSVQVTSTSANGLANITVSGVKDLSGNDTGDTDTFNINKNQITGNVELQLLLPPAGGVTRTVTFYASGGVSTKSWDVPVFFAEGSAIGTYVLTEVPEGTTGISAKTNWNLREKLAVTLVNGQAVGNFTGADLLRGGDMNNSNSVNILDYTIMKRYWSTADPIGDINADGAVNSMDYSLMKMNWFKVGEAQ